MTKTLAIQTALLGNWTEAIEINKKLLDDNPNDVEALNRIALAFTVIGKLDKARSTYKKVLEIDALNSIAIKNLKRIKGDSGKEDQSNNYQLNNTFIEETGKTKIIELVNIAQVEIVSSLKTGQSVSLLIKRSKVFIVDDSNKYIGVLPDDVGNRLIKLINGGNKYEAYVKSAFTNGVSIFIKELKRAMKFKDLPSFMAVNPPPANLKSHRTPKKKPKDYDEDAEESVVEES